MTEDMLPRAEGFLHEANYGEGPETRDQSALCAIAAGLIALCQRWDKATDEDGLLHVNAMSFDAYHHQQG